MPQELDLAAFVGSAPAPRHWHGILLLPTYNVSPTSIVLSCDAAVPEHDTNISVFEVIFFFVSSKLNRIRKVDQWLETSWKELEVPAQALAAASGNQAVIAEAKRHLLSFLTTANDRLSTRYCTVYGMVCLYCLV